MTRPMTRSRPLLLAAILLPLALTGCTASPQPVPTVTATLLPPPSPAPTASPAALRIPPHQRNELLRSTVTADAVREEAADTHGVRDLMIEVACAGKPGSTLGWTLEDGHGRMLVASTTTCDGSLSGAGWRSPAPAPPTMQLALDPRGGVSRGYGVVTRR